MKRMIMCKSCHGGGFTGNSGNEEDDACKYCLGLGSLTKEQSYKIKRCNYCDEIVDQVKASPIFAGIDIDAEMCKDCWNVTRDDIRGTYGRDIGVFDKCLNVNSQKVSGTGRR